MQRSRKNINVSEKNNPPIKTNPELTQIIELEDHNINNYKCILYVQKVK